MTAPVANSVFHALTGIVRSVERFKVHTAADFFSWCRETDTYPHIQWSMSALGISYEPGMPLSELKARLEWRVAKEERRRGHWSFDFNRLAAFKQMLAAAEKYQQEQS